MSVPVLRKKELSRGRVHHHHHDHIKITSRMVKKAGLNYGLTLRNYPKTLSSPGFYGGYTPFSDSYFGQ